MDWATVAGNWPAFLDSIEQRWPGADRDDLLAIDGDRAALTGYIARVAGLTAVEAEEAVGEWAQTAVPADVAMDAQMDDAALRASAASVPPGEEPMDDDAAFGDEGAPDQPLGRRG